MADGKPEARRAKVLARAGARETDGTRGGEPEPSALAADAEADAQDPSIWALLIAAQPAAFY